MENIMEKIEKVTGAIQADSALLEMFEKDPVKVIEQKLGVDLPDDVVEKVVDGVKAKLGADKLSGALGAFKKLF